MAQRHTWSLPGLNGYSQREKEEYSRVTSEMDAMDPAANIPTNFVLDNNISRMYVPDHSNEPPPTVTMESYERYAKDGLAIVRNTADVFKKPKEDESRILQSKPRHVRERIFEETMITGDHQGTPSQEEHAALPRRMFQKPSDALTAVQHDVLYGRTLTNDVRQFETRFRTFLETPLRYFVDLESAMNGRIDVTRTPIPPLVDVLLLLGFMYRFRSMNVVVTGITEKDGRRFFTAGVPLDKFHRFFAALYFLIDHDEFTENRSRMVRCFVQRKCFFNYYTCSCIPPPSLGLDQPE